MELLLAACSMFGSTTYRVIGLGPYPFLRFTFELAELFASATSLRGSDAQRRTTLTVLCTLSNPFSNWQ